VVTVIVARPFPVPEVGEGEIQGVLSLTDQVSVPPPLFVMAMVWGAGLPPPCWAVKERLDGLKLMVGVAVTVAGAAVMVKATGTVTVVAPGALRVIVAF
jgi:hypothetical protein